MEKILRTANTLALLGILVVLVLILVRLPQAQHFPSLKEIRDAKGVEKQKLLMEMPIVRIEDVRGTVSVDVTNSELGVSVNNTPLDVVVIH